MAFLSGNMMKFSSPTATFVYVPLFVIPLAYLYRYRRSMKKRLLQLEEPTEVMLRCHDAKDGLGRFQVLELTSEFLDTYSTQWKFMSLGKYFSTLRPALLPDGIDAPIFIQREMERFLAAQLLHYLGPRFGAAILPILGYPNIQSTTGKIAVQLANWFASHFIVDQTNRLVTDPFLDRGGFPFSFADLSAIANVHQSVRDVDDQETSKISKTPIELLHMGEVGYTPSFCMDKHDEDESLFPNPFVIEIHWEKAILGMEKIFSSECLASNTTWDPHDRSLPPPKLINSRLFPDLHLGLGSASCTHTRREIIRNRLLAILFNRLSHNYYAHEQGWIVTDFNEIEQSQSNDSHPFVIKFAGTYITTPHGFLWTLLETGHDAEVCPRGTRTTFGVAACVKESDGSWTNIPLSYFVRTGYESESARPAWIGVPHGGMDLTLTGPLVSSPPSSSDSNKSCKCNIQFYMAIEGMCGWHSNHNADVPWIVPKASTSPYSNEMSLQAVRMAGLLAVTFNAIGTEQKLPFGGYGVLGVCNDTAALLDQALRGTTNLYPLVSTGRYLMHIANRLEALRIGLLHHPKFTEELNDLQSLISATMKMSSNLQASPSNVVDGIPRYLACLPDICVFQIEKEGKEIMTQILERFESYQNKKPEVEEKSWKWLTPTKSSKSRSPSSTLNPNKTPAP
jgi:hypothetical protein